MTCNNYNLSIIACNVLLILSLPEVTDNQLSICYWYKCSYVLLIVRMSLYITFKDYLQPLKLQQMFRLRMFAYCVTDIHSLVII